jgi:hypothetical protein
MNRPHARLRAIAAAALIAAASLPAVTLAQQAYPATLAGHAVMPASTRSAASKACRPAGPPA